MPQGGAEMLLDFQLNPSSTIDLVMKCRTQEPTAFNFQKFAMNHTLQYMVPTIDQWILEFDKFSHEKPPEVRPI
jgi:hypothetical protein